MKEFAVCEVRYFSPAQSVMNLESREHPYHNRISTWHSNEYLLKHDAEVKATLFEIEGRLEVCIGVGSKFKVEGLIRRDHNFCHTP